MSLLFSTLVISLLRKAGEKKKGTAVVIIIKTIGVNEMGDVCQKALSIFSKWRVDVEAIF